MGSCPNLNGREINGPGSEEDRQGGLGPSPHVPSSPSAPSASDPVPHWPSPAVIIRRGAAPVFNGRPGPGPQADCPAFGRSMRQRDGAARSLGPGRLHRPVRSSVQLDLSWFFGMLVAWQCSPHKTSRPKRPGPGGGGEGRGRRPGSPHEPHGTVRANEA